MTEPVGGSFPTQRATPNSRAPFDGIQDTAWVRQISEPLESSQNAQPVMMTFNIMAVPTNSSSQQSIMAVPMGAHAVCVTLPKGLQPQAVSMGHGVMPAGQLVMAQPAQQQQPQQLQQQMRMQQQSGNKSGYSDFIGVANMMDAQGA